MTATILVLSVLCSDWMAQQAGVMVTPAPPIRYPSTVRRSGSVAHGGAEVICGRKLQNVRAIRNPRSRYV